MSGKLWEKSSEKFGGKNWGTEVAKKYGNSSAKNKVKNMRKDRWKKSGEKYPKK